MLQPAVADRLFFYMNIEPNPSKAFETDFTAFIVCTFIRLFCNFDAFVIAYVIAPTAIPTAIPFASDVMFIIYLPFLNTSF